MRSVERSDGSRRPFDSLAILFHWTTVILLAVLGLSGIAAASGGVLVTILIPVHRSAGVVVWCTTVLRFLWRASLARFPAFPRAMPNYQRWLVSKSEQLLYLLLFVQPLSGLLMTLALGRSFVVFEKTVPALFPPNIDLYVQLVNVHFFGAIALFSLAGGHAGMALIHHYVLRDDVLATMAPWVGQPGAKINMAASRSETATRQTIAHG